MNTRALRYLLFCGTLLLGSLLCCQPNTEKQEKKAGNKQEDITHSSPAEDQQAEAAMRHIDSLDLSEPEAFTIPAKGLDLDIYLDEGGNVRKLIIMEEKHGGRGMQNTAYYLSQSEEIIGARLDYDDTEEVCKVDGTFYFTYGGISGQYLIQQCGATASIILDSLGQAGLSLPAKNMSDVKALVKASQAKSKDAG